jgi:hypothetical protein
MLQLAMTGLRRMLGSATAAGHLTSVSRVRFPAAGPVGFTGFDRTRFMRGDGLFDMARRRGGPHRDVQPFLDLENALCRHR